MKLAVLDDEETQLYLVEKQVESYNRNNKDQIEVSVFDNSKDFIENFNHDLALIDINLRDDPMDGFDVARIIMKRNGKPVIMTSQMIDHRDDDLESLIPKPGMTISELIDRFNILKNNLTNNIMQVCSRRNQYHAPKKSLVG